MFCERGRAGDAGLRRARAGAGRPRLPDGRWPSCATPATARSRVFDRRERRQVAFDDRRAAGRRSASTPTRSRTGGGWCWPASRSSHARGLAGHSDADLVSHAVTDALLGAAGREDIGELFPSDDPALEGASSIELLRRAWATLAERGWSIVNVDAIVIMQEPRLAPHRAAMREALAAALEVEVERVTVRASTTDRLGFTGRGEGAACQAVALLERPQ